MRKIKPDSYIQNKKLTCSWTDIKKFLIPKNLFIFFVRHGMILEKIPEIISFKQSKWLEKCISFDTKKTQLKLMLGKTSIIYVRMLLFVK